VKSNYSKNQFLDNWLALNTPDKTMFGYLAFYHQTHLFQTIIDMFEVFGLIAEVSIPSTHRSKSIKLPVLCITLIDGSKIYLRDNFHNLKVSFDLTFSYQGFNVDSTYKQASLNHCYFEGFESSWVFGKYTKSNTQQFSCEAKSDYDLIGELAKLAYNLKEITYLAENFGTSQD
jgi:hypothetical protein